MLEQQGTTTDQMAQIRIALEPVVDILHLSGYAAAFADLHDNKDFLNVVIGSWKKLSEILRDSGTSAKILDWIITIHSLQHSDMRITSTSHCDFPGSRRSSRILREKGYIREDK